MDQEDFTHDVRSIFWNPQLDDAYFRKLLICFTESCRRQSTLFVTYIMSDRAIKRAGF
ncbi:MULTISPECIES: hypothetical protein [unclassified Microcoleus]|uniref:hypothetical protein n=1 Tax=unclassified Microcoleus TaxID=2642155 RepID=UPI002FD2DEF3